MVRRHAIVQWFDHRNRQQDSEPRQILALLSVAALIAQPLLIRVRRYDVRRAIGRASFALAPLVGISGGFSPPSGGACGVHVGTARALVDPIAVRLIFFYTSAGEMHLIYDVIAIAAVGTMVILIVKSRGVPRARHAFVALLVLFGRPVNRVVHAGERLRVGDVRPLACRSSIDASSPSFNGPSSWRSYAQHSFVRVLDGALQRSRYAG